MKAVDKIPSKKKLAAYIFLSILAACLLEVIVNSGNEIVFWSYFGLMVVSVFIGRWYGFDISKGMVIHAFSHMGLVFSFSFLIWGIFRFLL
ncbi:hypothetical protein [Neolewinella persica]|uniref:hypothetical protein n=1 Tax=Neolewinella persica TaxID=70998 RepID=UPI00036661F6|nr:hypothetical protein [Neolewinella persica]